MLNFQSSLSSFLAISALPLITTTSLILSAHVGTLDGTDKLADITEIDVSFIEYILPVPLFRIVGSSRKLDKKSAR